METLFDLKKMHDEEIQKWLRIIDPEDLKRGIIIFDQEIQNCIFRNMSSQAVKLNRRQTNIEVIILFIIALFIKIQHSNQRRQSYFEDILFHYHHRFVPDQALCIL